jgi:excinuclease ABC subunit A
MKKRVAQYMISGECPVCRGKRLKKESLSVKFAGLDISEMSKLSITELNELFKPYASGTASSLKKQAVTHPEKVMVARRIAEDLVARLEIMLDLGLGYLTSDRNTPTLSPGELQRLRLATQVRSNLFGVVYVLDEPSAGLHPADTQALLRALDKLKAAGNSLFVVEHEIDVIKHAEWIVDVGPAAGDNGGEVLYSGPPEGLQDIEKSVTRHYIAGKPFAWQSTQRKPSGWLKLEQITRNNLNKIDAAFPLGVFTSVTGVSGSGKSTLVSQVLVELLSEALGQTSTGNDEEEDPLEESVVTLDGRISSGLEKIRRLVRVDQKPIGRTPRSNLATYTGLFDHVRKLFASTKMAKARKYDAGRFSFNVAKGRCPHCEGEGFVMVELLFLPSVYTPCPTCQGTRYNAKTLEITYRNKNIADVLNMTVDQAWEFFASEPGLHHALNVVRQVGLGYLRLGQPATELSGGEAQRIKLAAELQRSQHGNTLYVLDEPTTGLHPSDVEKLLAQLNVLVDAGNTVIVVEHDMHVVAQSDWVIDMGPGAGNKGGKVVVAGTPLDLANNKQSRTSEYLKPYLDK